ncbi:MAG: SpoIID/LytB domain-containing protein [Spirochaetaceae bacterium]|nr:MAG: SpoIID/LytB domain-containing protein [Spirochaetaceae bacterium]
MMKPHKRVLSVVLCLTVLSTTLASNSSRATDHADTESDSAPPTVQQAVEHYYQGRIESAIAELEQLVRAAPQDQDARRNLALLLLESGRHSEALAQLNPDGDSLPAQVQLLAAEPQRALQSFDDVEDPDAMHMFWTGVAARDAGEPQRAAEAFAQAVSIEAHLPYAHYFLGQLALEQQEWEAAAEHLQRALRQDGNLTSVFEPLARAQIAQGNIESAYALLSRAEIALPWDSGVDEARQQLEHEFPQLRADREAEVAARRVSVTAPRVAPLPDEAAEAPRVRVGLAEDVTSIHLKTGARWTLTAAGSPDPVAEGTRDDVLLIERLHPGGVSVGYEDGPEIYAGSGPLELDYQDTGATTVLFDMAYGHGQFSAGREDRSYRGTIRILSWADRGFTVVNELNLEAYLMSVVPSEMPASWPMEALQAQAVAARSYTLAPRSRFHARGFDLLGSVLSAFYRGSGGEHPRSTEAVHATIGKVLMDGEIPLNAVYSANSAGYTESSASVWGSATALVAVSDKKLPPRDSALSPLELESWLRQRPESHSNHARYSSRSAYRWSRWVSQEELAARLGDAGVGRVTALITRGRGISGRVERVEVIGSEGTTTVERDAIRSRLGGLRSNLFTVYPRLGPDGSPSHFVVTGAGWGHGVGMDQSGAAGMAAAGYRATEILEHYYPQAELRRLY